MSVAPIAFRIYPDGQWLYAVVNIWPTKKSMQAHMKAGRGYTAICTPLERLRNIGGKWRKIGQFCEINFHQRQIGIGVVSHEMTHAAFSWAARRRISFKSAFEANLKAHAG